MIHSLKELRSGRFTSVVEKCAVRGVESMLLFLETIDFLVHAECCGLLLKSVNTPKANCDMIILCL